MPMSVSPLPARPRAARLDLAGAAAACACACHCVLLPLAAAAAPFLGLSALLDERVETAMIAGTAAVGVASFGPDLWRRGAGARRWPPALAFVVGLGLLLASRAFESERPEREGTTVVVAGAGLVAAAHLAKRRRERVTARSDASGETCCSCADD